MRRVEALPYTVEEAINKTIKELTKIGIEFHATGREIYINEDLILDKDASSERRSIGRRIKNYFKNEVEENYAILSFDDAPEGSYLVVEYTDHAAFTALAKILNLKSKSVMPEDKHVLENIDSKLERELKMINRDISGEDVSFEDEDSEEAGGGAKKPAKKGKKAAKKRELVFDENLGEVVARRKRKPGRGGWGDLGDY